MDYLEGRKLDELTEEDKETYCFQLAKLGIKVNLVDTLLKDQIINKERSYAITHSSRKLFQTYVRILLFFTFWALFENRKKGCMKKLFVQNCYILNFH